MRDGRHLGQATAQILASWSNPIGSPELPIKCQGSRGTFELEPEISIVPRLYESGSISDELLALSAARHRELPMLHRELRS